MSNDLTSYKARLPLADIVGRYVSLKRRGREYIGLCPFHSEKTPSFHVVEDKGFYHCFGCGANGSAIDFVMNIENLDFPDALRRVEEITGLEAPKRAGSSEPKADSSLFDLMEKARAIFGEALHRREGGVARAYLSRRGVAAERAAAFGLGYAPPERDFLLRALKKVGISPRDAARAGLVIEPEDGSAPYDRFRNRLMFPIRDARDRVASFGGRALGEAKAKYLNGPDTELFHKKELLYNYPTARRANGDLLVVEGYMDVIGLAAVGLDRAVAPLGTAISEEQLRLLWRIADEPILCLDGDAAGSRAAAKAAERALPLLKPGKSLRFAHMPPGEDPDSLARAGGRAALDVVSRKARPLVDVLWRAALDSHPATTPESRAALRQALRTTSDMIGDGGVRELYREEFDRRFDHLRNHQERPTSEPRRSAGWRQAPQSRAAAPRAKQRPRAAAAPPSAQTGLRPPDKAASQARALLGPLVREPQLLPLVLEDLARIPIASDEWSAVRDELIACLDGDFDLEPEGVATHLSNCGLASQLGRLGITRAMGDGSASGSLRVDEDLSTLEARAGRWREAARRLQDKEFKREEASSVADDDPLKRAASQRNLDSVLNARAQR